MGLLDNLDPSTETGQRFLGLLAAAGPQTDPTKTSYAARLKMAEDGVQDWKQNKLMGEYRQSQMDAQKRQWAAQEAQARQSAAQQEALGKLFNLTGGGGGFSPATDGVFDGSMKYTQPTPQKLQLNQQAVLEAARLGVDPKRLQEYADLQNIGMAEVARTIDGRDSDGRPVTYQKDKYGRDVASPVAQWKAPEYRDTGGAITAIDTITNKPILQLPKTQSFADKTAAGNLALSRERFNFEQGGSGEFSAGQAQLVKSFGKPPKDYRWKSDGTAEPIPGGPADIKAGLEGQKAEQRKLAGSTAADNVLDAVLDAKKLTDGTSAGVGSVLARIPATDARNLQAKLETVKANLGFDRLQQMRDMSPTGGALGAVAVQELTALQSTVASLDQGQSPAELKKSLDKIEKHYNNWKSTLNGGKPSAAGKSVVKTGTYQGRKVVQYSDGTTEYAD